MKRSAMGHTKLKKLARRLDVPMYAAVGLLECLWHLTARESPLGDIGRLSNEDIAVGLDWSGDEDKLVDALIESRWVDKSDEHRLVIHDWHDHADDATKKVVARSGKTFASLPTTADTQVQRRDMSRQVETNPEKSRLPEPEPEPEPEPLKEKLEKKKPAVPTSPPLARPTQSQIEEFLVQLGEPPGISKRESAKMFDHFEANGWRVAGKAPMRNWHAAARSWIRRAKEFEAEKAKSSGPPMPRLGPKISAAEAEECAR